MFYKFTHIAVIVIMYFTGKSFAQGMPISPCPKMFQYRFDGTEWFGLVSVRNPDFGQALHLRVTLSMRGKPTTHYLGEIELLTRGQFLSDSPVLYKVKFPKHHFPPKLLQISTNNQIVCLGAADHSIFMTQIQLEHTRKFTFVADDGSVAVGTGNAGGANAGKELPPALTPTLLPTNLAFGTKHLSVANFETKSPIRKAHDICGTIDNRLRFKVLQRQQQMHPSKKHLTISPARARLRAAASHVSENLVTVTARLIDEEQQQQHFSEINDNIQLPTFATAQEAGVDDDDDEAELDDGELVRDDDSLVNVHFDDDAAAAAAADVHVDTIADAIGNDKDIDGDTATLTHSKLTAHQLPSISRGAWPWLAAIYVNNLTSLTYQCGGTLVSSRVIISSAHCFQMFRQRYTANEVLVFLGRHNLKNWNEEGSLAAPVDDIYIHPDYDKHLHTYDADIAVIVLKNEVRFNTFIRPACMWSGSSNTEYIEGEHGIVVAWNLGKHHNTNTSATQTYSDSTTTPSEMSSTSSVSAAAKIKVSKTHGKSATTKTTVPRIIDAPIVSNEVCFRSNDKFRSLSSNRTFCAGIVNDAATATATSDPISNRRKLKSRKYSGPCTGDSGAGLMIFKNNRWMLRGTVSATVPAPGGIGSDGSNCNINQYVIYADVAKFLDWIFAFII